MAEHLARIIGTEEDRINCPFYWKIGACRHGDQCSRTHYKPTSSQTLIIRHLYQNPPVALAISEGQDVDDDAADQAQDHFEAFYQEVWEELSKFGEIEELVTVDNIGDHMIGNTYVKYVGEEEAGNALRKLAGRCYGSRPIEAEFSPVTEFREARCRQFVEGACGRGGYCNFMHLKHVPGSLRRKLVAKMYADHPEYKVHRDRIDRDRASGGSGGSGDYYRGGPGGGGRYHRDYYRGGGRGGYPYDDRERDRDRPYYGRPRHPYPDRDGPGDRDYAASSSRERDYGDRSYGDRPYGDRSYGDRERERERDFGAGGGGASSSRGGEQRGDYGSAPRERGNAGADLPPARDSTGAPRAGDLPPRPGGGGPIPDYPRRNSVEEPRGPAPRPYYSGGEPVPGPPPPSEPLPPRPAGSGPPPP